MSSPLAVLPEKLLRDLARLLRHKWFTAVIGWGQRGWRGVDDSQQWESLVIQTMKVPRVDHFSHTKMAVSCVSSYYLHIGSLKEIVYFHRHNNFKRC